MNSATYLQSILKASGWSQEELARRLDVSFVTLNSWINDRSQPRAAAAESIRTLYFATVGSESVSAEDLIETTKQALACKTGILVIVEDKEVLDKLSLHLTYHTNTIEGSTMTLDDTEAVLFDHKVLSNRTQVEQAEARNHQAALLWLLDGLSQKDFVMNEEVVLGLHLRLMNGILHNAGQYRDHGVRIMGSHVAVANYLNISTLMTELFNGTDTYSNDPVSELASVHARFEKIHPFSDGNGRVGRLIMLAQALSFGLVPPLVLKERRYAYFKYLELAQTEDNYEPLQLFVAESIIATHQLLFG